MAPQGFCFCRTKIFISPYAGTSHTNQTAFRSAKFKTVTAAEILGMLWVISVQIETFQESKTWSMDDDHVWLNTQLPRAGQKGWVE